MAVWSEARKVLKGPDVSGGRVAWTEVPREQSLPAPSPQCSRGRGDLQKGTPGHGLGLLSQLFQGHPWWETSLVSSGEAPRLLSRKGHIIVSAADPGHPFIFSFFFLSSGSNFPDESMERSICSQTPEPQWQQVDDIGWALMREG